MSGDSSSLFIAATNLAMELTEKHAKKKPGDGYDTGPCAG
jgi:hypothetical protein